MKQHHFPIASKLVLVAMATASAVAHAQGPAQEDLDISTPDSRHRFSQAVKEMLGESRISRLAGQRALHSFQPSRRLRSEDVDSVSLQHYYKNVAVIGSRVFHHAGSESQVDDSVAVFDLDARPRISAEDALGAASAARGGRPLAAVPQLRILPAQDSTSARLVYWVQLGAAENLEPRLLVIDAHSGEVISDVSTRMTLAPVDIYNAYGQGIEIDPSTLHSLEDLKKYAKYCQVVYDSSTPEQVAKDPITVNPRSCDQVIEAGEIVGDADSSAQQAAENAQTVLNYYSKVHKRNGIDGKGGRVTSVVHVGQAYSNAFWDPMGDYMAYGDGDGERYGDFTQALDVVGHEMTHGVVTATSNLMGMGEPGALNEATADFFGIMIESKNWDMGEDIFLNGDGKGFRYPPEPGVLTYDVRNSKGKKLADKPYPAHLKEQEKYGVPNCSDYNDNCWVHVNSTIWSHGLYRMYKLVGREAAERITYLASTQYFSENTGFHGASLAGKKLRMACKQLYGANSAENICGKVDAAMVQVGL